jgi:hypothetical protein
MSFTDLRFIISFCRKSEDFLSGRNSEVHLDIGTVAPLSNATTQ